MRIFAVISFFLLTACGFQPLYNVDGQGGAMRAELASIEISPIADRIGQVMRNRLIERMNMSGNPKYRLDVVLEQSSESYGTRPDAATMQEQITLVAYARLISFEDNSVVLEEQFRARTSFDIVLSDFATVTQREDSARRLALELAERIQRRLATQFAKS